MAITFAGYEIYMPRSVQIFYGKYADHPLVTGNDIYPVIEKTSADMLADLNSINSYVNSTFTHWTESLDKWHIMHLGGIERGDCEDFMLTKAQMLLEAGWSVENLKMEMGSRWIPDEDHGNLYDKPEGHAWLVANINGSLYALDNGTVSDSVTTRTAMHEEFYSVRMMQVNGATWVTIPDEESSPALWDEEYQFTITPVPHISVNMPILRFLNKITRKL